MTDFSARDIHRIDQASPEAWDDVDDLANDRETSRRLEQRGQDVYAAELARDLIAQAGSEWSLAVVGAMATIRRVQERQERNELRAECEQLSADLDQKHAELERLTAEANALRAGMTALTVDTDGGQCGHDEEIPIGEIVRVLHETGGQS